MSRIVRICRHEEFEAAHLLNDYDGGCGNLHGHSYKIEITLEGLQDSESWGMVMDFNKLKKLIKDLVPDHMFVCNFHNVFSTKDGEVFLDTPEGNIVRTLAKFGLDYIAYPFAPTAENMVCQFADDLKTQLPENVFVVNVKLWETTNSYAEWKIEDHPSFRYDKFRKENVFYGTNN